MAATLDDEIYYPVRALLCKSFMKVPNRSLTFQREFKEFTATPVPFGTLREIYVDRITESINAVEDEGNHISGSNLDYLERLISTVEILPADATETDLEPLLDIE